MLKRIILFMFIWLLLLAIALVIVSTFHLNILLSTIIGFMVTFTSTVIFLVIESRMSD